MARPGGTKVHLEKISRPLFSIFPFYWPRNSRPQTYLLVHLSGTRPARLGELRRSRGAATRLAARIGLCASLSVGFAGGVDAGGGRKVVKTRLLWVASNGRLTPPWLYYDIFRGYRGAIGPELRACAVVLVLGVLRLVLVAVAVAR